MCFSSFGNAAITEVRLGLDRFTPIQPRNLAPRITVLVMPALCRISDRVYWMPPGPPDRPSLCAVVGDRRTLMLDAGASSAHARRFLDGLSAEGVAPPSYVALTHSHWDHVFGAAEFDAHVIAQALTAETLIELAATDWSDEALDRRVVAGLVSPGHA